MSFFNPFRNNQSDQLDIRDIADNLENVAKSGDKFRATCPICGSKSARPFILFPNGGYYCHSCSEKGSVFSLIKDVLRLDFSNFKDILKKFNPFSKKDEVSENETPNFQYLHEVFHHRHIIKNQEKINKLLYELIPEETKDINHKKNFSYLGYDERNDTLAISLIDEDNNVVNIKRRKVGDIKWMGLKGGSGKFSPHRLTGKKFVYIASGIAEFLILNASELDYIVMQSDGRDINSLLPRDVTAVVLEDNDKRDIKNQEDERYKCFKNPNQFNPFKRKVTEKITGEKIAIDFEKILNREVKAGYDLRDFVTEHTQNWLKLIEKEVEKEIKLKKERAEATLKEKILREIEEAKKPKKEIVIPYGERFPDFLDIKDIKNGVIVSRQHTGKTTAFEGVAGTLIIVPKVEQCNVFKGDSTEYLLKKIFQDGAIITFYKFYSHYKSNEKFKEMIDSGEIRLVVDEAHELLFNPIKEFQLIYSLDAIFVSATLEKFFRRDLQRYKYKPAKPDIIYYTTNGELPKGYRSLVFVDNAKALKANYPHNSIVGKQYNFDSVDVHTTTKETVFTTSALREGVSVKNPNFNACMVYDKGCRRWSTKQKLQALYRVRDDNALKIISAPPKPQYKKHIDYEWWENFIKNHTQDQITNTIMGEHYSKMMEITHKVNGYKTVDEYSIVCYLSQLTRNNYDEDFFKFVEYKEDFEPLEIETKVEKKSSKDDECEIEYCFTHTFEDGEEWIVPEKKRRAFNRWLEHNKSGFIDKLLKFNSFKNLNTIYKTSNVAKTVKAQYNRLHKYRGERYSIDKFLKLIRGLVQVEMIDDKTGKTIQRVGSKTDLKNISIRVVGRCAIKGIKIIKKVKKLIKEIKKWLDSFIDFKKPPKPRDIEILKRLEVEIKNGNYYNIMRA